VPEALPVIGPVGWAVGTGGATGVP